MGGHRGGDPGHGRDLGHELQPHAGPAVGLWVSGSPGDDGVRVRLSILPLPRGEVALSRLSTAGVALTETVSVQRIVAGIADIDRHLLQRTGPAVRQLDAEIMI